MKALAAAYRRIGTSRRRRQTAFFFKLSHATLRLALQCFDLKTNLNKDAHSFLSIYHSQPSACEVRRTATIAAIASAHVRVSRVLVPGAWGTLLNEGPCCGLPPDWRRSVASSASNGIFFQTFSRNPPPRATVLLRLEGESKQGHAFMSLEAPSIRECDGCGPLRDDRFRNLHHPPPTDGRANEPRSSF